MGILVSCQSISKSYSSRALFRDISFGIEDRERVGLIGPNGSGKSTLLKILSGLVEPDEGAVVSRRNLRVACMSQDESFPADDTIEEIVARAAGKAQFEEYERAAAIDSTLSEIGFPDRKAPAGSLSGGWRKRLAMACALVTRPELLLMDEPTNHLDLEAVLWLETMLKSTGFSFVLVSHDRAFLEAVTNRMIELNPTYPQGFLSTKGNYSQFLLSREEQLNAQETLEQALASKARREIAWLQRGARARQTKSSKRIQDAGKLIEELADVKQRIALRNPMEIGFDASGRKTKELLAARSIEKTMGDKKLISDLSFLISPGTKFGIVGRNGSGKTTLLRLIAGQLQPDAGSIKRADELKVVWFDQNREQLDQSKTLKESLSPTGDSVTYRGKTMHVSTWARKFLFKTDQLNMPISYLSGGEQARILIANLMTQSADILILDEPTNDLDIPSLEVLEESLEEFPGAVVLVTHDRMMLDNVSDIFLALDGKGAVEFFVDFQHCEQLLSVSVPPPAKPTRAEKSGRPQRVRTGLSNNEARELAALPEKIEQAENAIAALDAEMGDPKNASDYARLQELTARREAAQSDLEKLFARWEDLESRAQSAGG